jgi:lambda repressor-like predicted transcriptional regulator
VRRYSKQPHLWRASERLTKLLDHDLGQRTGNRPAGDPPPHVHKLAHRLTVEAIGTLQQAYQTGASLAGLQQQFDLSRGSVQRVLREAGVRRRRKSLTDAEVAVLVERSESGLTIRQIAAEQGLAKTTVQNALVRAGRSAEEERSWPH